VRFEKSTGVSVDQSDIFRKHSFRDRVFATIIDSHAASFKASRMRMNHSFSWATGIFISAIAFGLAGCGDDSDDDGNGTGGTAGSAGDDGGSTGGSGGSTGGSGGSTGGSGGSTGGSGGSTGGSGGSTGGSGGSTGGSGGGATTDGGGEPEGGGGGRDCAGFCDDVASECTDANEQYNGSNDECVAACEGMTEAQFTCRETHLGLLMSMGGPDVHCPHVGLTGGGAGGCPDAS
jgi:hypothetical protein